MKFITTESIVHWNENIIHYADSYLMIISPFIQINDKMYELLCAAKIRGVKIILICGKTVLNETEKRKIKELNAIMPDRTHVVNVFFILKLHAKIFINENMQQYPRLISMKHRNRMRRRASSYRKNMMSDSLPM